MGEGCGKRRQELLHIDGDLGRAAGSDHRKSFRKPQRLQAPEAEEHVTPRTKNPNTEL